MNITYEKNIYLYFFLRINADNFNYHDDLIYFSIWVILIIVVDLFTYHDRVSQSITNGHIYIFTNLQIITGLTFK